MTRCHTSSPTTKPWPARLAAADHPSALVAYRGGQVIDKLHELGPQYSEQTACDIFSQVGLGLQLLLLLLSRE